MHVPHRWSVHFLIMYGSFRQKAVEIAAENSRALCNKSLRCLWKMIEIALKSSRDYCEKWWRLPRKVVEIASNNGRGDAKKRLSWLQKGARVGVRGA